MKDSKLPEVRSKLLNPSDILQDSLLSLHNLSERNFPGLKTKNSTAGTGSYTLSEMRSRYRIIRSLGFIGFSRTYLLAEDLNRFNQRCVLKFAPQLQGIEAIAIPRPTQTDSQLRFQQQRLKKMSLTGNLLSKSWFFVPFTAVLILGGYFCLMVAKLKLLNPVFHNNFLENIQQ